MKLRIALLILLVLIVGGWQSMPTKYEYKFEYNAKEKKVNELAAQNWELVTVGAEGSGPSSNVLLFVFRRPK